MNEDNHKNYKLNKKFLAYSLLAQSHNTPLLPPKILHNHCLQVLLGHEDVLREIKNYANFWGVKEVYYGICASSEWIPLGHSNKV